MIRHVVIWKMAAADADTAPATDEAPKPKRTRKAAVAASDARRGATLDPLRGRPTTNVPGPVQPSLLDQVPEQSPKPAPDGAREKNDLGKVRMGLLHQQTHGLYVLDEFTYPIKWGWIDGEEVARTLAERPGNQHVIITGRDPHPALLEVADIATEMTKVKHPMDAGRKGQKGIEW